jgi:hypothetical protein
MNWLVFEGISQWFDDDLTVHVGGVPRETKADGANAAFVLVIDVLDLIDGDGVVVVVVEGERTAGHEVCVDGCKGADANGSGGVADIDVRAVDHDGIIAGW